MFIIIFLINLSQTYASCLNDNECSYYCGNNGQCQKPIPRGEKCSGYSHHIRECDLASWCDSDNNFTCQLLKNIENKCEYDYSCIDNYCDSEIKTCQYRQFIDDHCQTETKTCQSTQKSSSSLSFATLILLLIVYCVVSKKKEPQIDVATQTDDAQHTHENLNELN